MEKKEISFDTPITAAGITLIPVTESVLNCWQSKRGISFFGIKRPFGVVLISPSGKRAFRVTGEEVPLDQLEREVPAIKEILGEYH